jgi:hypothetical protein
VRTSASSAAGDRSCINTATPTVKRIDVNASFMGVTFSPDSQRVYLSGGENGNIWIGDAAASSIKAAFTCT